jgi:hypothetical protein
MKKIWGPMLWVYLAIVAIISLHYLMQLDNVPAKPRNICSVAEISPDVTQQERERCRQIRGHKL